MPKSRVRVKSPYTPPPTRSASKRVSPPWVGPTMLACFLLGITWLVVFYFTSSSTENGLPIRSIGEWNLAIGFGFIVAGFGISTQWR